MGRAASLQEGDEVGVHERVIVRNIEDGDSFACEGRLELSIQAGAMDFLHDKDDICPLDLLLRNGDLSVLIEAGGICIDSGEVCKDRFGGGATEFIAGTEEEDVFLRHDLDLGHEVASIRA